MKQLIPILICAVIGLICFVWAPKRGRSPYNWFFIGLFFGILGLLALFLLPPLKRRRIPTPQMKAADALAIPSINPLRLETIDPSHESKMWYYLDQENQQFGPMSIDGLSRAWHEGKVTQATYVWNEVMENWKRLEEVIKHPIQIN